MMTEKGFELRGVSVGESNQRRLDDVSVDIPASGITVLAGPSGAGKSTLADLVLGLYTPSEGALYIDGQNLRECTRPWQRAIGYVPQSIYLFDDTMPSSFRTSVD